jgi:hypothetical protein
METQALKDTALEYAPWEAFAQAVASGSTGVQAYRQCVARRCTTKTAMEKASKLLANVKVKARVAALRELVKDALWEGFGWDQRRILAALIEIIETPAGEVQPGHRLCQEWSREKFGGGKNSGQGVRTKVKMPAKLDALRELNKMVGLYAPEKLEQKVTVEPTEKELWDSPPACHVLGSMLQDYPEAAQAMRDGLDGLPYDVAKCGLPPGYSPPAGEAVRVA